MYNINQFAMMEPMKYYNNEAESQKRNEILENKDNLYIGSEKHDGDWGMFIHYSKGNNLIRSRSISKVTGVYGDYTAKVPHLAAEMDTWPDNTVVLAELCFETYNNCNGVGTILRCLPEKAIERQKNNPLFAYVFDVLMIGGEDLTSYPYADRICNRTIGLCQNLNAEDAYYFRRTAIFHSGIDFREVADEIIANGGEGIVIQRKDNPYMPGTRTAWKTLKLKQSLPEMELKVLNTIEPKKHYEGDFTENWRYWEVITTDDNGTIYTNTYENCGYKYADGPDVLSITPITKPYFYHWKNGIVVDYNGIECSVTSGLSDDDRAWLATEEAKNMITNGELYAVVKGMSTNDKGAIRHPYLVRLRNDIC